MTGLLSSMDFLSNHVQVASLLTAPAARVPLGFQRFQRVMSLLLLARCTSGSRPRGQASRRAGKLRALSRQTQGEQVQCSRSPGDQLTAPLCTKPAHLSAAPARAQRGSHGASRRFASLKHLLSGSPVFSPTGCRRLCYLTPGTQTAQGRCHRENSRAASSYSSSKSYKSTSRMPVLVHMENTHTHIHISLKREISTLFFDNFLLTEMVLMFP